MHIQIHRFMCIYGAPFVKICDINLHNTCMTCQVWYVACHVLYIYAMFHIFMPCFIYWCHDLYIYAMIYIYLCHVLYIYAMFYIFMSISIHVASLFIYAAPRFPFLLHCLLSFMLYQHKFMLHQYNKFMLYQDLSAVPLFPSYHTVRSYHHLK